MKIGCVILAGGKSSRMGEDKALLEYDGEYFIKRIAEELSFFEEKIIARGNNSVLTGITDSSWRVIQDIYPEHGPMGGLHATLKHCESEAMFVVTCDMPLITKELVKKICGEMDAKKSKKNDTVGEESDAVIAITCDGRYHPLCGVYRKELYKYMEEQLRQNNNRMMTILKNCHVKYLEITKDESKQLANVNTKEEYKEILQIM